ncbi:MAG: DUF885 domain-containing protein [Candidatus Hodarchaeales archaeon]|jgi:uncharacterized protein (DUF885 family)
MDENQRFKTFIDEKMGEFFDLQPSVAIYLGKEGYEKKLEPGTKEHLLKGLEFFDNFTQELKKFDKSKLDYQNQIASSVVEYRNNIDQFTFHQFPIWKKIPNGLETVQNIIFILFQRRGPTIEVAEAVIEQLSQLRRYLEEFQSRFGQSPIPKIWKEMALSQVKTAPQFLQFLSAILSASPEISEDIGKKLTQTINDVQPVIQGHIAWIEELMIDETDFNWALGLTNFDKLLELRKLPWDRQTILQKGYFLLDDLKRRSELIAKEIDSTKTYDEVLEMIKADHPLTFEMVLEHTKMEADRAKEFVKDKDLATLPEDERLVVVPTPEYLIPIIPFAAYMFPPFFSPKEPGIYIVTPTTEEKDLKRHNYTEISDVMVHEAYPGHHLDFACNNAFAPLIQMLGQAVETIEGWAHYCEELMLEEGFYDDPKKAELIILKGQIWRAVRIIVDIELHCKQRTVREAITMLMEEAAMDETSATAEVTRYTFNPGYQLSYLVGKLLIDDLRKEVKEKMGDLFTLKFFHDTILQSANLPFYILKELFYRRIASMNS